MQTSSQGQEKALKKAVYNVSIRCNTIQMASQNAITILLTRQYHAAENKQLGQQPKD